MIKRLISMPFIRFALVGCVNTLVGGTIMFVLYNVFSCGYWFSSACNYVLASILSYFLNRRFTFQSKELSWLSFLRFALNICVCYFIAYGIAKPLIRSLVSGASIIIQDNLAMVTGMAIFMICNFFGQKLFVFRKKEK